MRGPDTFGHFPSIYTSTRAHIDVDKGGIGPNLSDAPERSRYAHPWPEALPGLGARVIGPFARCTVCGTGSWARYGLFILCLACAQQAEVGMADPTRWEGPR